MAISKDFADYCCELLSGLGSPTAKRMFGGWSIYIDGLSIAWLIDLTPKGTGNNEKLYLRASDATRAQYEAAGCQRFIYDAKGVNKSVNYYAPPTKRWSRPMRCCRGRGWRSVVRWRQRLRLSRKASQRLSSRRKFQ